MVAIDKAVIAKLHNQGNFEILVDPELALEFRKGKKVSVEKILAVRDVFTDSRKGDRASGEDLKKVFGTEDVYKIAEAILKHGDIQLTTEQRHAMVEEKKKQIINLISRQVVDPKTKLPHPPQRILNAMEDARVGVDPFKPADAQVEEIIKKLESALPMSTERVQVAVHVPMEHAGKVASQIRNFALVKSEEWKGNGWYALLEVAAATQADVYQKLNDLTHGQAETKVVSK